MKYFDWKRMLQLFHTLLHKYQKYIIECGRIDLEIQKITLYWYGYE